MSYTGRPVDPTLDGQFSLASMDRGLFLPFKKENLFNLVICMKSDLSNITSRFFGSKEMKMSSSFKSTG